MIPFYFILLSILAVVWTMVGKEGRLDARR